MVQGVNRAVRAIGCANCRLSLVRSFTALSGVPIFYSPHQGSSRATFTQNTRFSSNTPRSTLPELDSELKSPEGARTLPTDKREYQAKSAQTSELVEDSIPSSLPWYLQDGIPVISQRPLTERQRIPELPDSSPPILEPLLQQISVDLGLDDLKLLDLRGLDPPPALGANLLMIIGTARSEKHLHVSAGSLCRWLRSEYQLRPDADGLLGRNELKLKMRRKNRRAKLLGSGNGEDDYDDGVRTGWVCVNVGTIKDPDNNQSEISRDEKFVGFGQQTEGVKIVVQMLVEEKRKELDLEKLWSSIKKRQLLGISDTDGYADEFSTEKVHAASGAENKSFIETQSNATEKFVPFSNFPGTPPSTRSFHTSARSHSASMSPSSIKTEYNLPLMPPVQTSDNIRQVMMQKDILAALRSNDYAGLMKLDSDPQGSSNVFRSRLVESVKQHLDSMPLDQALEALGSGPTDLSSTPLLSCLNLTKPGFSSEEEWEFRVWLYCFGQRIRHEGYDLTGLKRLFKQLQLCGINISRSIYMKIIHSALDHRVPDKGDQDSHTARVFVTDILWDMHMRGLHILSPDVFIMLHEDFSRTARTATDRDDQDGSDPSSFEEATDTTLLDSDLHNVSSQLNLLMHDLGVRITKEEDVITLLGIHAKNRDWPAFWDLWRSVPRSGAPRSGALYAFMFQQVAKTKHQRGCIKVLRDWIPDMEREQPEVKLEGDVLESVKACLDIVDPFFQETSLDDRNGSGEWLSLWQRCYPERLDE